MNLQEHIDLKNYTTMQIGGTARYFMKLDAVNDIEKIANFIEEKSLSHYVLGGGSNTIFSDKGFDGLVIFNQLLGFVITDESDKHCTLKIGAGENWDEVVARTVEMNLSGIEALSAIPGTAGATPVQNVGAYGQEIADVLVSLDAYDFKNKEMITMSHADCKFSYRDSIFKSTDKNRYLITSISLRLNKTHLKPPFYSSLQKHFDNNQIEEHFPANIRAAVVDVRKSKLPSPDLIANSGSFFKNPIVDPEFFEQFLISHPEAPHFDVEDGVKIPAGWLIEEAGLKGIKSGHFSTYNLNSLVITNDGKGSFPELIEFVKYIQSEIEQKFSISIEPEPNLL